MAPKNPFLGVRNRYVNVRFTVRYDPARTENVRWPFHRSVLVLCFSRCGRHEVVSALLHLSGTDHDLTVTNVFRFEDIVNRLE
jgi:hypothetical protein